jgi:hypothetical protein
MKKKRTFIERWVENRDDWSFGEVSATARTMSRLERSSSHEQVQRLCGAPSTLWDALGA